MEREVKIAKDDLKTLETKILVELEALTKALYNFSSRKWYNLFGNSKNIKQIMEHITYNFFKLNDIIRYLISTNQITNSDNTNLIASRIFSLAKVYHEILKRKNALYYAWLSLQHRIRTQDILIRTYNEETHNNIISITEELMGMCIKENIDLENLLPHALPLVTEEEMEKIKKEQKEKQL